MKQTSVDWLFQQLWETPKDKLTWHSILEKAKQMENKQTAVQWLIEKIQHANPSFKFDALIRQAKQMEKEQMIESYCQGCFDTNQDDSIFPRETSEQYYNENYKSE